MNHLVKTETDVNKRDCFPKYIRMNHLVETQTDVHKGDYFLEYN